MKIELSYINTNHPDFTDGAAVFDLVKHEFVCEIVECLGYSLMIAGAPFFDSALKFVTRSKRGSFVTRNMRNGQ